MWKCTHIPHIIICTSLWHRWCIIICMLRLSLKTDSVGWYYPTQRKEFVCVYPTKVQGCGAGQSLPTNNWMSMFFFLELFLVISNQQDLDLKDCICVQLWLHYTNHIQGKGLLMIQNTTLSGDWKSIILRCFYDFSFVLFFSERTT